MQRLSFWVTYNILIEVSRTEEIGYLTLFTHDVLGVGPVFRFRNRTSQF